MWIRGNFLTPELHRKMGRLISILNSELHAHCQNKSIQINNNNNKRKTLDFRRKLFHWMSQKQNKATALFSNQKKEKKFNAISHYSAKPLTAFGRPDQSAKREIITFPVSRRAKVLPNVRSSAASS